MKTTPPDPWSDSSLDAARQQGDPEGDALAAKVIMQRPASEGGRLGYNHLVDLADVLEANPELLLIHDSHLATELAVYPAEERNWYDPLPAPSWVDPAQLKLAGTLWEKNSLAMLGALYAASLPACYLIKNGIPALYQTGKLKGRYIYQRIFETGIMLEAVMQPGGLEVVNDVTHDEDEIMVAALQELDKDGQWKIQRVPEGDQGKTRKSLVRSNKGEAPVLPVEQVLEAVRNQRELSAIKPRGYLWGVGYIQAKKVRLLHSSMRFMLQNPDKIAQVRPPSEESKQAAAAGCPFHQSANETKPWDSPRLGVPINQEDLAYTLLTFGYSIPKGLSDWGCKLNLEHKEAFLHLWRVVGHIMGLRDDLMTDKWDEAERLFDTILKRQSGKSPDGVALTEAVMGFLADYLPKICSLNKYVPIVLIADLLPNNVADLLSDENNARLKSPFGRSLRFVFHHIIRLYYRYYSDVLGASPLSSRIFGDLFSRASDELISSWRDEYRREPFYIPKDDTTWELRHGASDEFSDQLQAWRRQVLAGIAWPMTLMMLSAVAGVVACCTALRHYDDIMHALASPDAHAWWWLVASIVLILASIWRMDLTLPAICARRPKVEGVSAKPER